MKEKNDFIIETCYHCGNKGQQQILFSHEMNFGAEQELEEYFNWFLLKCPVCGMLTLKENYSNECMVDNKGEFIIEEKVVYPKTKYDFKYTPKVIQTAFESAVKVSKIDSNICLLSLRRTLEMICKDKVAKGKTLEQKIKDLSSKNILPATLNDSSWLIRTIGNEAAHADTINYTEYEVAQIIGFVEQIITYLYELPECIAGMKESRQKRINQE